MNNPLQQVREILLCSQKFLMSGVAGDCEDVFWEMWCKGKVSPFHISNTGKTSVKKKQDERGAKHHVPCFPLTLDSGKNTGWQIPKDLGTLWSKLQSGFFVRLFFCCFVCLLFYPIRTCKWYWLGYDRDHLTPPRMSNTCRRKQRWKVPSRKVKQHA